MNACAECPLSKSCKLDKNLPCPYFSDLKQVPLMIEDHSIDATKDISTINNYMAMQNEQRGCIEELNSEGLYITRDNIELVRAVLQNE